MRPSLRELAVSQITRSGEVLDSESPSTPSAPTPSPGVLSSSHGTQPGNHVALEMSQGCHPSLHQHHLLINLVSPPVHVGRDMGHPLQSQGHATTPHPDLASDHFPSGSLHCSSKQPLLTPGPLHSPLLWPDPWGAGLCSISLPGRSLDTPSPLITVYTADFMGFFTLQILKLFCLPLGLSFPCCTLSSMRTEPGPS